MYTIKYVDNQGNKREETSNASCFTNAVMEVEKNANEMGHGLKELNVKREGEAC